MEFTNARHCEMLFALPPVEFHAALASSHSDVKAVPKSGVSEAFTLMFPFTCKRTVSRLVTGFVYKRNIICCKAMCTYQD